MIDFDFDIPAERRGTGNMKYAWLPTSLQEEGLLNYSGAELDMKTAPCIRNALVRRAENGLYGYTLADELYLSSLSNWLKSMRGWSVERDWIVPTYGIIQALNCAIRAFTNPGDSILIQPPVYHMYAKAAARNNRRIVENPLKYKQGVYEIDFDDLERKMAAPETKLMVLCNPHNPIMDVWETDDLRQIAELAQKHHVIVFSDEIFAEHSYAGVILPYGEIDPSNSIVLTSLGKAFNFTGLSHGNAIINNPELRAAFTRQRDTDHFGSVDPFIYSAQIAAYTPEGKAWIDALLDYAGKNSMLVRSFFSQYFPDVICCRQRGGTLIWIDMRALGMEENQLHDFLLNEAKFQLDCGSIYGAGGECFVRVELGTPRKNLEDALDRLLKAAGKRGIL